MTSGNKILNPKSEIRNKFQILIFKLVIGLSVIISTFWFSHWSFALSKAPQISPEAISPPPTVEAPLAEGPMDTFSFVVFGDNRDGDKIFMDLIEKVNQEENISFAVNTGDFVSRGRENEYRNYLEMTSRLKVKVYNVPGNHDLVLGGDKYFGKYFGPLYYSFDYKNSHFVVLNNAFKRYFDAEQFEWLKNDLASTKKENIFVFMHRPTFDPTEIHKGYIMSGRKTIEELMRLFRRSKVDYVFAGHLHGYARAKRKGTVYIIAAGAGAPLYLPKDFGGFYHYVKIRVDGKKITDEVVKIYE